MRLLVKLVPVVLLAAMAMAQDNHAAGTWKLNVLGSNISGPLPSFVHDGLMTIRPEIVTGKANSTRMPRAERAGSGTSAQLLFEFDLSADGRTLTLTRPATDPGLKIVFDRQ